MNRRLTMFGVAGGVVASLIGAGALSTMKLGSQQDGSFLVSSGQRIELLGTTTTLPGLRPKDTAVSPNKRNVAVLTTRKLLVTDLDGKTVGEIGLTGSALGVAWDPRGGRLYASLGSGKVGVYSWNGKSLASVGEWAVEPTGAKGNPMPVGMVCAPDGKLYVALSIRNKIVELSDTGEILRTFATEACPYHLTLSPDGTKLAASNRGGAIVQSSAEQMDPNTQKPFEGTGIASADSAGTKVRIDPRTDAALGGSITLISLAGANPAPQTVNVGRQPSGATFSADGKTLFVANADEDSLSIVDTEKLTATARIPLAPKEDAVFGQIPTDVALDEAANRIYVTLGGANAIAVLQDIQKPKVAGYVPTAWYPIALEKLDQGFFVGCAKGIGSRPPSKTTGYGVHDNVGAVQVLPAGLFKDLGEQTKRVARNNDWTTSPKPRANREPLPVPQRLGEPSVFKHVVYIIKENLTYDVAMGDIASGNGDPSLCTFPENVTPNHHALAKRFGLFDNFYISGTNSADGHQWVASSIANDYMEHNYAAATRSYPYDGGDALAYSPSGFLWSQAKAAGKSVKVFGEFVDKPQVIDTKTGKSADWQRCWADYKSGKGEVAIKAVSSQAALNELLHPTYIGFPSSVSDQWRADTFLTELGKWERDGSMPNFSMMLLPNDHTVGTRAGWPTPRAAVADNDLALGRIVEAITKSKFWKDTVIIVAQDDSQLGLDHVDGHRSVLFVISPYSKPNTTVSDFYNHATIAATIGRILGFPPMTRFDATAKPMVNAFGDAPNLAPYTALKNNIPLDELNPTPNQLKGESKALALACNAMDWEELDTQNKVLVNRAVWMAEAPRSVGRKGFSTAFPHAKSSAGEAEPEDE